MTDLERAAGPQGDDSAGTKFVGSLINALIFVAVVAGMTFVLVLLFKYGVRAAPRNALVLLARWS